MTTTPLARKSKLKPGAVVRCRTRRYLVEEVQPPVVAGLNTVAESALINGLGRVMESRRQIP